MTDQIETKEEEEAAFRERMLTTPKEEVTKEEAYKAIKLGVFGIKDLLYGHMSSGLIAHVVAKDVKDIQWVPADLIPGKMVLDILINQPNLVAFIPKKISESLWNEAFEARPATIFVMPKKYITDKHYKTVLRYNIAYYCLFNDEEKAAYKAFHDELRKQLEDNYPDRDYSNIWTPDL